MPLYTIRFLDPTAVIFSLPQILPSAKEIFTKDCSHLSQPDFSKAGVKNLLQIALSESGLLFIL
jgi:hypothetical protein